MTRACCLGTSTSLFEITWSMGRLFHLLQGQTNSLSAAKKAVVKRCQNVGESLAEIPILELIAGSRLMPEEPAAVDLVGTCCKMDGSAYGPRASDSPLIARSTDANQKLKGKYYEVPTKLPSDAYEPAAMSRYLPDVMQLALHARGGACRPPRRETFTCQVAPGEEMYVPPLFWLKAGVYIGLSGRPQVLAEREAAASHGRSGGEADSKEASAYRGARRIESSVEALSTRDAKEPTWGVTRLGPSLLCGEAAGAALLGLAIRWRRHIFIQVLGPCVHKRVGAEEDGDGRTVEELVGEPAAARKADLARRPHIDGCRQVCLASRSQVCIGDKSARLGGGPKLGQGSCSMHQSGPGRVHD